MIGAGDSRLTWRTKTEEVTGLSESPMLRVTLAAHEDGGQAWSGEKRRAARRWGHEARAGQLARPGPVARSENVVIVD